MNAGSQPLPVVVIGAGPTGVTVATLLGQCGIRVLVLDRWDGVYPQPRAVHLDDEVYRILHRVGIGTAFAAVTRPTLGLRLVDRHHRTLATFHREGDVGVHGYPRANMYDQPELEGLLRANLADQESVTLRGGVEVSEVVQCDTGVRVRFTDRSSGKMEEVEASYVLGCDGANSVVRQAIGARMEDLRFEQRWLVVDVASDTDLDQWDGVHQVCDPRRAATYMRVGVARYRWEFQLHDGESAQGYGTIEVLLPLIEPWVRGIRPEALCLLRSAEYTFRAQIADRWRDRNVLLLGDAAHLTPPFIGQGLCAGQRDAMNLAWKLAGVRRGELAPSVLDSYETERRPHALSLIKLAKLIGAAMSQGGRGGEIARRIIAPRIHLLPGLREKVLDSQTPPLARSELIRPTSRRSLAGRLCPNAVLDGGGGRFDEVSRGRFVLVCTVDVPPRLAQTLATRGARVVRVTPGSDLGRWLAGGHAKAAIVRPDYTVMAAGDDLAALVALAPTFLAEPAA